MKRISILVNGKVHGVFYRASTERQAHALGLTGFVRNEKDGSVYIEAQGNEEQLRKLTEWCHNGPDRAIVTGVNVSEIDLSEDDSFLIQR